MMLLGSFAGRKGGGEILSSDIGITVSFLYGPGAN